MSRNLPFVCRALALGWAFLCAACLRAVVPDPITVPVQIFASAVGWSDTSLLNVSIAVDTQSGTGSSTGGALGAEADTMINVPLVPGRDYTLYLNANFSTFFKVHFNPPMGYAAYIDDVRADGLMYTSASAVPASVKLRIGDDVSLSAGGST